MRNPAPLVLQQTSGSKDIPQHNGLHSTVHKLLIQNGTYLSPLAKIKRSPETSSRKKQ
jgi:hypothetical protein